VILRRCADPNPDRVEGILRECFEDIGAHPRGRVLIKPNVVTANRDYIHHSYTHPGVTEALVREIGKHEGVDRITIGESSGYGVPPGLFLREAGYDRLAKRLGVRLIDFSQDKADWTPLTKGVAHKGLHLARSISQADTKIWATKLKWHICCEITNALKLNVGILQHRDRMAYHDDRLNEKIVDLLEVGYPDIVVTDAIVVGHGFESAPQGLDLGLLMVADDPLASDAVAAEVLCYRPEEVVHLRKAAERGYGSIALEDFDITGDVSIDELQVKTKGVESEYQDIHKVKTPIRFYCGDAPDRDAFCYGGCLAALKGCLGTIDKRRPGSVANAKPGVIVTGIYKGDVVHPDLPVLLIGDCTRVEGRLEASRVKRLKGCPIGAAQLFFRVSRFFKLPNPTSDIRQALLFIYFSVRHMLRSPWLR
jgi:uncharacterized protein (DUF362 family)